MNHSINKSVPTINELRAQNKWPFPTWKNGHIVIYGKPPSKRKQKDPYWYKDFEIATF